MADGSAAIASAAAVMADACLHAFYDICTSEANFGCDEIEALAALYRALGDEETATDLVQSHATNCGSINSGDCDCEDTHHTLYVAYHYGSDGQCPHCGMKGATDG